MNRVLIIEDDRKIALALSVRLKAAGFEVVSAMDGYQGVDFAKKHQPDVIVLDVSMPAGGGFSVVEKLRKRSSTSLTPFIVITASKKPAVREQAERLGCAGFLEKPFEAKTLIEMIHDALGAGTTGEGML